MVFASVYAALAIVSAIAWFLVAEWLREPGAPASGCQGRCATVAGLLWPVVLVGIVQWGLIIAVQSWLRGSVRTASASGTRGIPAPVSH